ncbi:Uncharacterized protein SCF082_LOCUS3240, partial [Durusdinium trenchii]
MFEDHTKTLDSDESRPKTVLDDLLASIVFAEQVVAQVYERQGLEQTQSSKEALQKTKTYVLSIFMELVLNVTAKSVSINGKNFRIYSALRFELMAFVINSHIQIAADSIETSRPGSHSSGFVKSDPIALAEKLCSRLVNAPVKEIIHDEEDEGVVRIAQFMLNNASNSPRATLEKFLSSEMSLPFGMLSVHRELWLGFTNIPEMSNATLVDFFNMVQTTLQQALLPQWIGFAADCAEQYVWQSNTRLTEFICLRMRALQHLVRQALQASNKFDALDTLVKAGFKMFGAMSSEIGKDSASMQLFAAIDLITSSTDSWASLWADAFTHAHSPDEVVKYIMSKLKLKDTDFSKFDIGSVSKTKESAPNDKATAAAASAGPPHADGEVKAEQVEGDAPQAQEETTKHGTTTCPLVDLYLYKEKDSNVMSDSEDAKALGLTSLSTLDIMLLKSQMEAL